MIKNTNDGSQSAPYLSTDINIGNLSDLPDFSTGPKIKTEKPEDVYRKIKEAGFMGVQGGDIECCRKFSLKNHGGGRVNVPAEAETCAQLAKDSGHQCVTLHVGWVTEDDASMDAIVDAIINASVKHDLPMYIETHRATITQDIWRTVELTKRFPEVRFNGDFSKTIYGNFVTNNPFQSGGFTINGKNFFQLDGLDVALSPNFSLTAFLQHSINFDNSSTLLFSPIITWIDDYRASDEPYAYSNQESFFQIDFNLIWKVPKYQLTHKFFIKNLSDETVLLRANRFGGDVVATDYGNPRMFGIQTQY